MIMTLVKKLSHSTVACIWKSNSSDIWCVTSFRLCIGVNEVSVVIHNWVISAWCFQTTLFPWNVRHLSPSQAAQHPRRIETSFMIQLLYLYPWITLRRTFEWISLQFVYSVSSQKPFWHTNCRNDTSSTVSKSWATQLLKYGSDFQQGEEVSLLQSIQTGSRAHQDYSMGNGDKVDQIWIWLPTSNLGPRLRISRTIPSFPHINSWHA